MTHKHTPGPKWELNGLRFVNQYQETDIWHIDDFPIYAAAPELLEACQLAVLDPDMLPVGTLEVLERAIAKAEGRA